MGPPRGAARLPHIRRPRPNQSLADAGTVQFTADAIELSNGGCDMILKGSEAPSRDLALLPRMRPL